MELEHSLLSKILRQHHYFCVDFSPITTGKFNSTFICFLQSRSSTRLKNSEKVILRIAPSQNQGFIFYEKNMMAQEPNIHKTIRKKTSLPIPEIYVYDNSHKIINRNYLIMEFLPGKALSEVTVSAQIQKNVFEQTGRYLRELHDRCTADMYGYLGKHQCMKAQETWQDAFFIMWNNLIEDVSNCDVYNSREAFLAKGSLEKFLSIFDRNVSSSLLHMDIWSQNILIENNGNITGIVDWDRALWGDPEIEFAVLDYCGFNNPSFWEGYGKKPDTSSEARIRMIFYHLYEVQKYLVIYTLRRSQPKRVNQYKLYSLNLIDQLLRVN